MALPTSTNNVTVRKLSSTLDSLWTKIKNLVSPKADKVTGATNGNFAGLDSNGNLTDSGKKSSDFATSTQGSKADSAIQGVKVNGTALTPDANKFVDVTKSGLGLGNVTNDAQVKRSEMGVANGVATLDANGKIPTSQIPGSYDDVREGYYYNGEFYTDSAHTNQMAHVSDIVYVDIPNNKTYRWSGTQYVMIGSDLALGETSSTAYRGDRGKAAYDHSQLTSGNPHHVTKDDVGLGNVDNKSAATLKSEFTGSVAANDTGFPTGGAVKTAIDNAISGVTNEVLGSGYSATATNSSGTFAVTLANYVLAAGGIVAVKFGADVPASAKLNVNSNGAKNIYWKGAVITAGVIQNGDTAFFMYNDSKYHLLGVDRSIQEMTDTEVSDLIDALS